MLHRDSPIPLYHQLKELLAAKIAAGEWRPGDLIPGEMELQSKYSLSRTTVRQALRELEIDGMLSRYRGRGTFVARPKLTHGPDPDEGLTTALLAQGMFPSWSVLESGWTEFPHDVRVRLGERADSRGFFLRRLRLANEEPIGLHVAYVASAYAEAINPSALSKGFSIHYLDHHVALKSAMVERLIEATGASEEEASVLDIEPGVPVLRISRLLTTRAGEPVEDCRSTYRGDRFQYHLRTRANVPDPNNE